MQMAKMFPYPKKYQPLKQESVMYGKFYPIPQEKFQTLSDIPINDFDI